MRRFGLAAFIFAALAAGQAEAVTDADYTALNKAAIEQHILPRYERMQEAASKLDDEAKAFCAAPAEAKLTNLQAAYHGMTDAWQDIQHVRFGPIDLFFRSQRIAFWPDPRNTIGKQMAELLNKRNNAALTPDHFGSGSVAVQGLPALERLLFGNDASKLLGRDADAEFRCKYIQAVTRNLANISRETLSEWREGAKSFTKQMLETGGADARYREPKEASLDLFKSLYTAVELAADHKLARPLGASAEEARPRLAESWRSERSLRNIRLNLLAAQDLYKSAFAPALADKALDAAIMDGFSQAWAAADAVTGTLEAAVQDKAARSTVEKLAAATLAVKNLLVQRLPQALDIPVGFNALDGD
ncbi:imelysin family protein [uncultured Ferrovibrio sp.]|jgi:predicted lipoprotein|uniref:imelysin family protein n=1 Tax=uncultured Ferrovibrio sp. TaxID=1576913 RepID=UPI002626E072|nr:imelysin family protein [uncultured Ferrovibrio sp.]